MTRWTGAADAYAASFGTLCAGPTNRLLHDTRGREHLDIGCGTGALVVAAADAGRSVTAIDSDPDMVAMTEDRLCGHDDLAGRACRVGCAGRRRASDTFDALAAQESGHGLLELPARAVYVLAERPAR